MVNGRMVALAPPRELRETGLTGTLLEVECDAAVDALDLLPTLPGVREVTLYGTLLHVLVLEATPRPITQFLQRNGVSVTSIRPIKPSLEDVFVSRIRGA